MLSIYIIMNIPPDYTAINEDAWDKRTGVHIGSEFYDIKGFMDGKTSLNETELSLLGDITGKTILHLQCHFGLDSLSLARMGAKVTGMDLSGKAIEQAKAMNDTLGLDATFICSDIYALREVLQGQFDLVFTSYGVIGWLPDLQLWGSIIDHFLKPGGRFILAEFHPVVWMFDPEFAKIQYSYFNKETIIDETTGTYTDRNAPISYKEVSWNHSLDEVFAGLLQNGLSITGFREYDFAHYNCFAHMHQVGDQQFRVTPLDGKIPLMYTLTAQKAISPA